MTTTQPTFQPASPAPAPRRSATGRVLLVLGVVLGIATVLWVALFLVDLALSRATTTHESYAAAGTVELVADDDVTVQVAEGGVEVDRIAHSGLTGPTYRADESADRLVVTHECTSWLWFASRCGGELDVTVPADTELVVRSSNGDVLASGVAGDVELESSNGDVEAASLGGRLDVYSSNGDVVVRETAGDVDARSSNGDVEVSDVGGTLDAETSNGRVDVDGVTGAAVAVSSSGDVVVEGVGGDVRAETSNGEVTVTGDGEPVNLVMDTSNGSQTVEGPTDPASSRTVEIRSSNGDVAYLVP
ncbi:DUF4097 family beta strand repeat-containing protein [Isoptericola cucumis]|uniref:DUF4097 family beta strand repeat-containing protein n=1 Tax=Isoptericola cucumis TaxID=1776856 RepID=UPI003208B4AC